MNELHTFRNRLSTGDHLFADTLAFVAEHYDYQPSGFDNAGLVSEPGQNEGSCKTLGLAQLENFSKQETLLAFGEHYRSVLATPEGKDHGNIRALMTNDVASVVFEKAPLVRKQI